MYQKGMKVIRVVELEGDWEVACKYFKINPSSPVTIEDFNYAGIRIKELLDSDGNVAPGTTIKNWSIHKFRIVAERKSHLPEWF